MSTTIDTNIVQMKFDNKQFEQNCKQSMGTLEKLRQTIDNSTSGKALDGLNKIDLSTIKTSIDDINKHFSLLGIAALKVKNSIVDGFLGMAKTLATTVPNIIKQGGWDRAMNIEQAKFQLEGLHVAWQDIKGDIEYAVDGTAYGLDAAAKAASQLVASGVEVGDSMKNALRAISGVAAMTNTEYESISPIFTTVAGQGKVMTMQLRQLENRGLNAAATMAEYFKGVMDGSIEASDSVKKHVAEITKQFGYGEAAVRDMVTKGVIDFNTFSNAMDNAFGEHAKDANRTFTGVTANIRAALKKIGADFATPIIEQDGPVVLALQRLRERINDVRSSLGPLTEAWTNFVRIYGRATERFLKNLDMSFMKNIVNGLVNSFEALLSIIRPIGYALKDVFAPNAMNTIQAFANGFEKVTAKLILSQREMENLRATLRGLLSVATLTTTIIKQILGALLRVAPETINIGEVILSITATIANLITYVSLLIQKTNIVGSAVSALSNIFGLFIGIIAAGISKIIEFGNYLSRLGILTKALNGIEFTLKVIAGLVLLVGTTIKNVVLGTIQKVPGIISSIKTELGLVIDFLKQFNIIRTVIDGINKLAESIDKLLHPKIGGNNKELRETITIADEAVALAGPQKMSILERFVNTLIKVKDKLVDVSSGVLTVIKNFDYGAAAAIAFMATIAMIGYRLSKTFESVGQTFEDTGKAIREVGGLIGSLKNRSIMELIFGKKEPPQQHKLLEFAAAMLAVAASVKLMTTIDGKKLKEVGVWLGVFAAGLAGLAVVFTILQKVIGKGETLAITNALFAIGASITLMVVALAAATKLDFTNIQKAGAAIVQLTAVLTAMAIALAKLAPALSTGSLSLLAMAYSLKIMVGTLGKLNNLEIEVSLLTKEGRSLWGKTGLLMTMAAGLVLISGMAAKLGTNSLLGIILALTSLKIIMPLVSSVITQAQTIWNKTVAHFEAVKSQHPKLMAGITTLLKILGAIAAILAIVAVIKAAVVAIKEIGSAVNTMGQETSKFAGLQKALARLSLVPVIMSLTAMFIAIGAMTVVLGKIKLQYLDQAIKVLATVAVIFVSLGYLIRSTKDSKPAAIIGAMVGLTVLFSELIVLTLLVEKHSKSMMIACGMMASLMLALAKVFKEVANASQVNGKALIAIGMIGAIIAELGGIMYLLSQQDWTSILSSGAAMTACMLAFSRMLTQIGKTGQSFTKNKFIAIAECAAILPVIAGSLALATLTHDWKAMLAAGGAMSAVMATFGLMMQIVGKTRWNVGAWSAVGAIAVSAIAIGAALTVATLNKDWQSIVAASEAMSIVMIVFGGMAAALSNVQNMVTAFAMMATVSVTAVAIAGSLAILTTYPWEDIRNSAIVMAAVMVAFSAIAVGLGALKQYAVLGALVVDLLAAAMVGMSTAATMLLSALTLFLPVANEFIGNVLGTLVGYAEQLPSVGVGLIALAAGLAAVGMAGVTLTLGVIGLAGAALALPSIASALMMFNQIDLFKIASGLAELIIPGVLIGPMGIAMGLGAPGILLVSAAITAFAGAMGLLSKTLDAKIVSSISEIPKKMIEIGLWIPKSLANGIAQGVKTAVTAAKNLGSKVIETIRNKLQIHSESPLFNEIGGWISKSLGNGIGKFAMAATGPVGQLGSVIVNTISGMGSDFNAAGYSAGESGVQGMINGFLSKLPEYESLMGQYGNMNWLSLGNKKTDTNRNSDDAKQEQIRQRKEEADAARKASSALDDYTNAAGKAGKASKDTADKTKDLSDAFKEVSKGAKVNLKDMITNLHANLKEHATWAFNVRQMLAKGYDQAVVDAAQKAGVAGHETVKAYLTATEEEVAKINAKSKEWFVVDDTDKKIIEGDYGEFGSDTANAYLGGLKDTIDTGLAKSLQDSLDPFKEFNSKVEMSSAQLLKNMQSQLDGYRKWGDNLNKLMERGVEDSIIQHFKDAGVASYEELSAMVNMTDEQLSEARNIWTQQLNIGNEIAGGINHQANLLGLNIGQGLIDGLESKVEDVNAEAVNMIEDNCLGPMEEIAETHSPSARTDRLGQNLLMGLNNGLSNQTLNKSIIRTVDSVFEQAFKQIESWIGFKPGRYLGENMDMGLVEGLRAGASAVTTMARKVAMDAYQAAYDALQFGSPSKMFIQLGEWLDDGFAIGIDNHTNNVVSSTEAMADSTIQMMNDIIKNITNTINDDPELQPVIRPELDLTALQNGKSRIAGMLNNPAYAMATEIYASQQANAINVSEPVTPTPNSQTLIFNQTNNSPKRIDPYESYRLGRLAMEQMKGAFT